MTATLAGALVGGGVGLGLVLVWTRVLVIRRPSLAARVQPYLRDLPGRPGQPGRAGYPRAAATGPTPPSSSPAVAAAGVFGPVLRTAADGVERVLGGATSVRRRLERAGLERGVHDFRVEQVLWGLTAFAVTAAYGVLRALTDPGNPVLALLFCVVAFALGVLARDSWLSSQVKARERRILAEFPTVAELLALAVAAGESPVAALDRVVRRSRGALSADLARVLAAIRTGEPVGPAFDALASSTGLPLVSRFAQGIAVAVERGTPLSDVLHAQAADVREAGRRELIEVAARREVVMMVPRRLPHPPGHGAVRLLARTRRAVPDHRLTHSTSRRGTTMSKTMQLLLLLHTYLLDPRSAGRERERDDRGDVPGWVLVTVMSVAIVMGIWTVADEQLNQMLRSALAKVK